MFGATLSFNGSFVAFLFLNIDFNGSFDKISSSYFHVGYVFPINIIVS